MYRGLQSVGAASRPGRAVSRVRAPSACAARASPVLVDSLQSAARPTLPASYPPWAEKQPGLWGELIVATYVQIVLSGTGSGANSESIRHARAHYTSLDCTARVQYCVLQWDFMNNWRLLAVTVHYMSQFVSTHFVTGMLCQQPARQVPDLLRQHRLRYWAPVGGCAQSPNTWLIRDVVVAWRGRVSWSSRDCGQVFVAWFAVQTAAVRALWRQHGAAHGAVYHARADCGRRFSWHRTRTHWWSSLTQHIDRITAESEH